MGVTRYTEHRTLEAGPLLVADSTMESGARMVWVGAGGMEGRWLTHAEFRAIVAELVAFADALPPSGVQGLQQSLDEAQRREVEKLGRQIDDAVGVKGPEHG